MNKKTRWLISAGALAFTAILLSACKKEHLPLATVPAVDLNKYAGTWYEVASFPQRFQEGCHCTQATYTVKEDFVEVYNACRKDAVNGKLKDITGKAFPVDGSNNSKLKVQFFWPFKGDYWILALAEDYSHVLVGSPDRESLWILARNRTLPESDYKNLVKVASEKGFDTSKLQKTVQQNCPD